MNSKTSESLKVWIKRNLYQISFNVIVLIMFVFGFLKLEDSIIRLIIAAFVLFFTINLWSVINCFKRVQALNVINRDDLNKTEKKRLIIAVSIMYFVVGISSLLLWVNKNVLGIKTILWIIAIISLVSGTVFIIYNFTIKKAALRRKLEQNGPKRDQISP